MRHNKKQKRKSTKGASQPSGQRGVLITLASLLFVGAATIIFVFSFNARYANKIFPGTSIGNIDLSGMTYEQAKDILVEATNALADRDITISFNNKIYAIQSIVGDQANSELALPIIFYDVDATIDQLLADSLQQSEMEHIFNWVTGWQVKPVLVVESTVLIESLQEELGQYETPAIDAAIVIDDEGNITTSPEASGTAFDYDAAVNQLVDILTKLEDGPVFMALNKDVPDITQSSAEAALATANQVLAAAPFSLVYEDKSWPITYDQVQEWLELRKVDSLVTVGLNSEMFYQYLEDIAAEIDVEVKEAKFSIADGRVSEFQLPQQGLALQIFSTAQQVDQKIVQVGVKAIDLIVAEVEPESVDGEVNDLGIKELLGEGRSNFTGSPANRRHNIAIGAAALNGLLIAPGEEFSLIGALGEIDASSGYRQELVIKGNKTIPEYGGGLCQVSTTTFRAVLDAGLDVTARRNHSYRVAYYEPVGTDATIYDPAPDFKFINDTENHVLLTTEIDGDDLVFRFYGTADGRQVEQTKPRVFNIVKPPPAKLIETTDLAPGVKKCTERAHDGVDTVFTRTITYADGTTNLDEFRSHYVPWQEVCLIGVEEINPDVEAIGGAQ
ncbi:VanW family protein [Patescibacteria group bacterium]|nr:VanW family protein [Patescibacteria group bacterium]